MSRMTCQRFTLLERSNRAALLRRVEELKSSGVNVVVLLAIADGGRRRRQGRMGPAVQRRRHRPAHIIFQHPVDLLHAVKTSVVAFDTQIMDLTPLCADPVDLLFGFQMGGGVRARSSSSGSFSGAQAKQGMSIAATRWAVWQQQVL